MAPGSMNFDRYLCSQLVELRIGTGEAAAVDPTIVNLEEIWESGAVLESEEPVEAHQRAEVRCGKVFFSGEVVEVERHEFGWRVTVQFSPMTPWRREAFQPEHLLLL